MLFSSTNMAFFNTNNQLDDSLSYSGSSNYSTASMTSASSSAAKKNWTKFRDTFTRERNVWAKFKASFKKDQKDNAASLVERTAPIETTAAPGTILDQAPLQSAIKETSVPSHPIANKLEQPHINYKQEKDDDISSSSDDGETLEDKLDQLRRDNYIMRSELSKLQNQSVADINQIKADHYDLLNELQQINKNRSMLQYHNKNFASAIDQLTVQKSQQQQDHEAKLAKAAEETKAALKDLEKLNNYNLKLQDSISQRKTWNEALKFKIEQNEKSSAEALSQLANNIKQRGEQLEKLRRQLASKENELVAISSDYERATADLAITYKAIIDAAAEEKHLTDKIEAHRKELTEKTAEVNRLGKTAARQSSIPEELAAAYKKMADSTNRILSLENAIKIANDEMQNTTAADEKRISSLQRDLANKKNSLESIRRLVQ